MDLESENSALESTGDNDLVCSTNPPIEDSVKVESNGSCFHDDNCDLNSNGNGYPLPPLRPVKLNEDAEKLNCDEHEIAKLQPESASLHSNRSTSGEYVDSFTIVNSVVAKGTENDQPVKDSPLSPPKVPLGGPGISPPATATTKGKGLRKWRRIRRDVPKDGTASPDVTKILKRGSANFMNSLEVLAETKQKSEDSVSSTNAFVSNPAGADSFSIGGSSSIYKAVGVSTCSVGADSDNSEDRSSKSSTAASASKSRHDPSRVSGHSREKYRMKHRGGKHLGNTSQRLQQGVGQVDTSKKPRGGVVNMDKENSFSSLESDSRSYSSVFMQGSYSAINNGHSERSVGCDGEHSYDGVAGEQQSVEGPPSGSIRENEEISQGDAALSRQIRGKSKNNQLLGNGDPLVDCVRMLQSAQEALEQEILKFGSLGKDLRPLDDSIKATGLPIDSESASAEVCGSSSSWPTSEDAARDVPHSLEAKLVGQAQNSQLLDKQLEEATGMLKEKESRITELEATINDMKSSSEDLGRSIEAWQKKYKEIEAEMECLYEQKMEAEIKYLAIADKCVIAERQMKLLLAEQKSVDSTQVQALRKVDHLESKAAMLKDKTEGLSTWRGNSGAEIPKIKKRAVKFSSCFFIQLILFVFVLLELFTSQLLPKSAVVMPT